MINTNPNLIRVVVKHSVFKDILPNDARCFSLSLINNPRHLVLKALRDIVPPHPSNHKPIMLFSTTTLLTPTWLLDSGASHHVTFDLSNLSLHAFSDADWTGNKDNYTFTSAYIVYLGRHPISWSSKKQCIVARSSIEAKYFGTIENFGHVPRAQNQLVNICRR